jgi:hypothetical protein
MPTRPCGRGNFEKGYSSRKVKFQDVDFVMSRREKLRIIAINFDINVGRAALK